MKKKTIGTAILASFLLASGAPADGHKAGSEISHPGKGHGKSLEKQSERAAERSNAQWQEGAKRGQERAAEVRDQGEHEMKQGTDEVEKQSEEMDEKADAMREAAGKAQADAQPSPKAQGFWGRLFGSE